MIPNKRKLREIITEVFKHYNRNAIYKEEFYKFFKNKGINEKEIEELWLKALAHEIIDVGITPITDPNNPLNIKEIKKVFILKEKWTKLN